MKNFICGVCEGFYGRPWTITQRMILFKRLEILRMNTYMYAPKDDHKHRLKWRQLYNQKECSYLQNLIEMCKHCGCTFIYAISPGLDIVFSNHDDCEFLAAKLLQVKRLGCTAFAVLFDDIDSDLIEIDETHFKNPASAQSTVCNKIYARLDNPSIFLFCPTEYCSTRALPDVERSSYLYTISKHLHKNIKLLWTGNKVVSDTITAKDLVELAGVIGESRPIVIWENLHANDYDHSRVYLGPYKGRSKHLLSSDSRYNFCGVLTNPNCEFEANYIPMHTLAQWAGNTVCRFKRKDALHYTKYESEMDVVLAYPEGSYDDPIDLPTLTDDDDDITVATHDAATRRRNQSQNDEDNDETEEDMIQSSASSQVGMDIEPDEYNATRALNMAIRDWIAVLYMPNEQHSSEEIMPKLGKISASDLMIIIDMFYLPYEHGEFAVTLLKRISWILSHLDDISMDGRNTSISQEWYNNAIEFHSFYKEVANAFEAFSNITNTSILYSLHSYMNDMRSAVSQVNRYIRWRGIHCEGPDQFTGMEQEPWVNTGGLVAEIKRLMPTSGQIDLYPIQNKQSVSIRVIPVIKTYIVSQYTPSDKAEIYKLLNKQKKDVQNYHSQLLSDDCQIRYLLRLYSEFCYILYDEHNSIVGFSLATPSIEQFRREIKCRQYAVDTELKEGNISNSYAVSGSSSNLSCFPAYLVSYVVPDVSVVASKALLNSCQRALVRVGVKGVHVALDHEDRVIWYKKHGYTCTNSTMDDNDDFTTTPTNVILLFLHLSGGGTTGGEGGDSANSFSKGRES